ncbi:MAG: acyl-CoA dehydrogenase [Desulfobacteraceae bacterium]|nr:MAG: acyl-CoA dehydrogenase [Desulfobacteraceae bacterium]
MNSALSPEHSQLASDARRFAVTHFVNTEYYDLHEKFPEDIWRSAGEEGLLGSFIQKKYGGRELGYLAHTLIMEEFWRVDPGIGNILLSVFGAELLQQFGSEEQKAFWLPLLAKGKAISCCAITEPDAGSDIFNVSTLATKLENGWSLTGSKQFITNANRADLILIFAVTDQSPGAKTKAFSFFLSDRGGSGLSAQKMSGKMGIRASDTAEIRFTDRFLPGENLLGDLPGNGFAQAMSLFNINRLFACGQGVGIAQGSLDLLLQYLRENPSHASSQIIQYRVAEMATSIEASRQLYLWAGYNLDRNNADPGLIAMAKLFAGETGVRVVREAVKLAGPKAAAGGHPLSRFYRDAKIVEIYEGAKDLEKLTIARQVLTAR